MAPLQVGDKFPSGVIFEYVKIESDNPKSSGMPVDYDASKEWANKKVVLFSVPGAFTPGCQGAHIPPIIEKIDEVKSKADLVAVIGYNDGWVMCAWGKINGISDDKILFLSDSKTHFSKNHGWEAGLGERNGRYAMIIDHGKVTYAEVDKDFTQVTVSGVDAVLKSL
ncbi:hypothetical protein E8E13_004343 [Curvularia kusanoi]|uniref:Thioredoxin domain-containing protein n=1 Tax=Curvularia kusanoi TaxID=90978 RepID=A0A9P4W771_CURKU|nr:hypothetical protein E8E13_004343 [Curvularia kusanoi]